MISVVVPIYNEEEIISQLHDAVVGAMKDMRESWEVVYVNDGSKDSSLQLLRNLQLTDTHVVVVDLSRNRARRERCPPCSLRSDTQNGQLRWCCLFLIPGHLLPSLRPRS